MSFRESQLLVRQRYLAMYNAEEASKYNTWISAMNDADHDACIADLKQCVKFFDNMEVLDAGSGTGALSMALVRRFFRKFSG